MNNCNSSFAEKLAAMSKTELCSLFKEISFFRDTGTLPLQSNLRKIEKEFSDNQPHTRSGECMRLVEDKILYEMSRRYCNGLQ